MSKGELAGEQGPTAGSPAAELASLLRAVGRGEESALATLYDLTSPRVFGLALRIVRDRGIAEEVVQEVYIQVWRQAAGFDPARGSALAWLLTLTHRRAVDRVRSEQSQTDRLHRYELLERGQHHSSAEEEGQARIDAAALRAALDMIGEPHRTAVALAYLEGLTHREVADHESIPLGTAKTRIRDGLSKLRDRMRGGDQR
ncbi:sigma-70 family RNA polymerase sigma factor [Marihabitans asiaticum]|uniref:RNA polymerase ECF family sigma subunit n=1 Tax=Marihabitans asiaticum TaxID=415218 RepID=A0A560W7M4_9MICO|nr:sigma-70 family RNA polymerase sigma factor [Marihabitans asiaticum]TWD13617.1 RNA polymerase ECF family sigma subunit [Marihabitans asiaticum]